jgi:uncharacterized repeat protein (TIGR03803 family)
MKKVLLATILLFVHELSAHAQPMLYGLTSTGGQNNQGTLFTVDIPTGIHTRLYDFDGLNGAGPQGSMVELNGLLYGLTAFGGNSGAGTIFSFDPPDDAIH